MSIVEELHTEYQNNVGREIGVSDWIRIDQPMIDGFAAVTMDRQFIHTDPERAAAETPFGGTIAHGFLLLSLGSKFALDALSPPRGRKMSLNYGFDRIRFLTPVRCNDRVRGRFVLNSVRQRAELELLQEYTLTVEIEDREKPALIGQWLGLSVFESETT